MFRQTATYYVCLIFVLLIVVFSRSPRRHQAKANEIPIDHAAEEEDLDTQPRPIVAPFESYCAELNSTEALTLDLTDLPRGYLTSHQDFQTTWSSGNLTGEGALPIVCKWRLLAPKPVEGLQNYISLSFDGVDVPREPYLEKRGYLAYFGAPGYNCAWSFVRVYLIDADEKRQVIAEFCGNGWIAGFSVPIAPGSLVLIHGKLIQPFRGFRIFYESRQTASLFEPSQASISREAKDASQIMDRVVLQDETFAETELVASVYEAGNMSESYEKACFSDTGFILSGYSGKIKFVQPRNSSVWCRWVLAPQTGPNNQLKYIKFRITQFHIETSENPCVTNALEISFVDDANVTRQVSFCELKLPQPDKWHRADVVDALELFFKSSTDLSGIEPSFEFEYFAVTTSSVFHADFQQCGRSLFRPSHQLMYHFARQIHMAKSTMLQKGTFMQPLDEDNDKATTKRETKPTTAPHQSKATSPPMLLPAVLSRPKRVVGGSIARPGSWPWVAILSFFGYPLCAATILSDKWLLTAANCFKNERRNVLGWEVIIGKQTADISNNVGWDYRSPVFRPNVQVIMTHYRYGKSRNPKEFDIALIKIEQSIPFGRLSSPICPPSTTLSGREVCFIAGWGETNDTLSQGYLNEAQVPIISNDDCRELNPYYSNYVSESMICAGYVDGGVDNCRGDNGGPLMCYINGRWELHGIVSWGKGCAKRGAPGVYTRVSSYLHWIQKVINSYP